MGPRVGVSGPGGDGTAYPWRFWLAGDPSSRPTAPGPCAGAAREAGSRGGSAPSLIEPTRHSAPTSAPVGLPPLLHLHAGPRACRWKGHGGIRQAVTRWAGSRRRREDTDTRDGHLRRAAVARPGGTVHRRGGAARRTRGGTRHALLRLRPHRAVAALRQPRPALRAAPPAGGRPPRDLPRRRLDRPHRRPASPTSERVLRTRRPIAEWVARIQEQVGPLLDFEGDNAAHRSSTTSTGPRRSQRARLPARGRQALPGQPDDPQGGRGRAASRASRASPTPSSATRSCRRCDYLELYRAHGCTLQTGGSDQWGNLTAGVDLIHRAEGASVHALTTPLLTDAAGTQVRQVRGQRRLARPRT